MQKTYRGVGGADLPSNGIFINGLSFKEPALYGFDPRQRDTSPEPLKSTENCKLWPILSTSGDSLHINVLG